MTSRKWFSPRLCERAITNGKMWCVTHDQPFGSCNAQPRTVINTSHKEPLMEMKEGKILAHGCKRGFTPSDGET